MSADIGCNFLISERLKNTGLSWTLKTKTIWEKLFLSSQGGLESPYISFNNKTYLLYEGCTKTLFGCT